MRILVAAAFVLMLAGCGDGSAEIAKDSVQAPDVEFSITKDESGQNKRSVEILLAERITESQLTEMAEHLYKDGPARTFMGYYIEGDSDYSYWATTHYNPELSVSILGSTIEQHEALQESSRSDEANIVGEWRASRGIESHITIYQEGDELRMSQRFQDGSELNSLLYESNVNGETRYAADYAKEMGEYYIIGEDGRLQMWSDNGNYYTAPIDD
ncbi:hypothetical protein [Thalassospira tepidiphila]|uniref:hypothetical protein n=1 Tax=Thalassospira tepidiphila TaxID=393657 RepID=UPI003AA8B8CD